VIRGCLEDAGVTADAIDCFVPHSAKCRTIESLAHKFGIRTTRWSSRSTSTNTSAASVPLALSVGIRDGCIKRGWSGDD
jgi:3-oxoacyl-[acyl-carrier-protein] synthase-3